MTLLLMLLLKSPLVFALAGAALVALRRASAAARHLVCLLTLAALLVLPLFSLTLPGWHVPVLEARQVATLPEPTPAQVLSPPETGRARVSENSVPGNADIKYHSASTRFGRTPAQSLVTTQGGGFLALYLLGVLLAALRPLLGLWGIARLFSAFAPMPTTRRPRPPPNAAPRS